MLRVFLRKITFLADNTFFFFSRKIKLDICELFARQTVHIKCQALFSLKNINISFRLFCAANLGLIRHTYEAAGLPNG